MLGRLQYIALVLDQLRPFLGPLYAWVAATPGGACLKLPPILQLIFKFLLKTLEAGPAMVQARRSENQARREFRADAKAEGEDVGIGGWLCHPDGPEFSPWFSVKLNRSSAPWAFRSGEPFRAIASLELYATLLCTMLLPWSSNSHDGGYCTLRCLV